MGGFVNNLISGISDLYLFLNVVMAKATVRWELTIAKFVCAAEQLCAQS